MIGVPSVRKWLASSLPLEPKSEPWLKGSTLHYDNHRRHPLGHNTTLQTHNTPYKQDFWCDSKQVAQNRLNLDRSDPLTGSHEGRWFVSNIHQSLESHKQKAMRAAVWTFSLHSIPAGCLCVWALDSRRRLAGGTRSRWSGGSDKHSPSFCRPYGSACSGGNCRRPEPSTP